MDSGDDTKTKRTVMQLHHEGKVVKLSSTLIRVERQSSITILRHSSPIISVLHVFINKTAASITGKLSFPSFIHLNGY